MVLTVQGHVHGKYLLKRRNHLGKINKLIIQGPDMPEFEPRGCPRGASFFGMNIVHFV